MAVVTVASGAPESLSVGQGLWVSPQPAPGLLQGPARSDGHLQPFNRRHWELRGRKEDGKTDPSFAAVISSGEAAFSEKLRLLPQVDAIDKFAVILVPNSRPTVASLFTSQQFLIF